MTRAGGARRGCAPQVARGTADHRRRRRAPASRRSAPRPAAADLIIIYNSGRYRMAGRGSLAGLLPYGDANAIVVEMAAEVLPVVRADARARRRLRHRSVPAHAGLPRGSSGTWASRASRTSRRSGLIDGTFRQNLEETGMGYGLEVEMIRAAHELDLLDRPYVFTRERGARDGRGGRRRARAAHGPDDQGHDRRGDGDDARRVAWSSSRRCTTPPTAVNPDILVLCHGGPIAEPEDAAYVLERTQGVVGFFGASSMERLPTEVAMTENMRRFKAIPEARR